MSCTVIAVPYALAWVVGAFVSATVSAVSDYKNSQHEQQLLDDLSNMNNTCEDVVISEKHFIEKDFETPFMDKDILIKTLKEHGILGVKEDINGKITGTIDSYTLNFVKKEADKPYYLRITCLDIDNPQEKVNDLSSEYALNVQEEAYLSIVDKLKENSMEIEDEEVMEDNTIVLTVNLE